MTSARPTAASAAATAIEKMTKITPVAGAGEAPYRQNAMKFKFAAFSINSIPSRTRMVLLRDSAPISPTQNSALENKRQS